MSFISICGNKLNPCDEIWEDKYSCFSEDANENASAHTINITNQFTNSLIKNKGNINKDDINVFLSDDFCIDNKHSSEKVIDKLQLEVRGCDNCICESSFAVAKVNIHINICQTKDKRIESRYTKEERKEMWKRLRNQSSKEILKNMITDLKHDNDWRSLREHK